MPLHQFHNTRPFMLRCLVAALMVLVSLAAPDVAQAQGVRAGDIEVRQAWSRATPQGAKVAAGYLEIINHGTQPDTLVAATTTISGRTEMHQMSMTDGVMRMRPVAGGIAIAPGQTVALKPGGLHVMFLDLSKPLKQGEAFTAVLQFAKAGKIEVRFDVQSIGAREPAAHGHGH